MYKNGNHQAALIPVATRHRRDMTGKLLKVASNQNTHTCAFPSNDNDLEYIKIRTTRLRCIKFRHSLRCIDVWSFLFLKQIPLSNGNKYPMLCGYRTRCSWIKAKKIAPNQNLTSEKANIDRKFKKIAYPSGWHHGLSRNTKGDRQVHATFLKQIDFYTPCARWHVFLFGINVYKNENTNHFR